MLTNEGLKIVMLFVHPAMLPEKYTERLGAREGIECRRGRERKEKSKSYKHGTNLISPKHYQYKTRENFP